MTEYFTCICDTVQKEIDSGTEVLRSGTEVGTTLVVDDSLTIQHYHSGELGLTLSDAAGSQDPQPTYTALGDPPSTTPQV